MAEKKKRSILKSLGLVLLALAVLIQFVPRGRDHTNPPVTGEPAWNTPATRDTFMMVCGDCHSNETRWPWYSHVAPVSWLVERDVKDGRRHFNVSTWDVTQKHGDEAAHEYEEGEMPLWFYTPLHPEAVLSPEARGMFITGMHATFGTEPEAHGDESDHEH